MSMLFSHYFIELSFSRNKILFQKWSQSSRRQDWCCFGVNSEWTKLRNYANRRRTRFWAELSSAMSAVETTPVPAADFTLRHYYLQLTLIPSHFLTVPLRGSNETKRNIGATHLVNKSFSDKCTCQPNPRHLLI